MNTDEVYTKEQEAQITLQMCATFYFTPPKPGSVSYTCQICGKRIMNVSKGGRINEFLIAHYNNFHTRNK